MKMEDLVPDADGDDEDDDEEEDDDKKRSFASYCKYPTVKCYSLIYCI